MRVSRRVVKYEVRDEARRLVAHAGSSTCIFELTELFKVVDDVGHLELLCVLIARWDATAILLPTMKLYVHWQ